ncbi:glycosyltransferase family 2 protein [Atlantibacter hermannii]|uniref:glycosyltransferase family 2 protein n=1 Tax=Atlantibacter hermannii TaxID=565 RepID=UPI001C70A0FE|nr:glycosyltransferase family 2 protein [Atlantibacter hermannii]MBW9430750.1 glycosyltransferase family 2 protein [Atlantibacter hermannii]
MKISLVVPVYNEEDSIPIFYDAVRKEETLQEYDIEILFINDGSVDNTQEIISNLVNSDELVRSISLTRNFGKEPALLAGIEHASGDVVIPIDVDLQDPIDVVHLLIKKWSVGYDVVLAKRVDRATDSFFKRKTAEWFYKLHNKISNPKIEENVGDFRLLSREMAENIKKMPEKNIFMKGMLSWAGGKTAIVEYSRAERSAGKSKFNTWKLWNLALEGLTSFSTLPLRMWTYIGFGVSLLALTYAIWMVVDKLIWGNSVPGYPSIMTAILFLGGIQLIGIGILGEYVGRIYIETKNRPRYILSKKERE